MCINWLGMFLLSIVLLSGMFATTLLVDASVRVTSPKFIAPIAIAMLAGVSDPVGAQATFYIVVAVLMLRITPVIRKIPEHHGAW